MPFMLRVVKLEKIILNCRLMWILFLSTLEDLIYLGVKFFL